MRFKLTLDLIGQERFLPINYQYEFSSWIYKTIHFGDPEFAKWLHNFGYMDGYKQFKLFTFSRLYPEKYKVSGDRLELQTNRVLQYISFYANEAVEPFIIGLFKNQEFSLGDQISKVHFRVNNIEKLAEPDWRPSLNIRAETPIVISVKETETSKFGTYLSPEDSRFGDLVLKNLTTKYLALMTQQTKASQQITFGNSSEMNFSLIGKPKSKLVKIKAGTPNETLLKGYIFDFSITAPVEIIRLGYYGGFGEKNSLGFGYGELESRVRF